MEKILDVDSDLLIHLNNMGNANWDGFWVAVTDIRFWVGIYIILLAITMYQSKDAKKALYILLAFALSASLIHLLGTYLVKPLIARPRPCNEIEIQGLLRVIEGTCKQEFSFFSGHAANAFAQGIFVMLLFKDWNKALVFLSIILAMVIAYSRVYLGVHYPLDIICGALIGSLSSMLFYHLFKDKIRDGKTA